MWGFRLHLSGLNLSSFHCRGLHRKGAYRKVASEDYRGTHREKGKGRKAETKEGN